jgi:putative phosphoribosyl transferase
VFADRTDAGRRLGERLATRVLRDPVVVALPRGGVPVAAEIAAALGAPLDVLVVRKLGSPMQPELGMGAIAEGGFRVLNEGLIAQLGVTRSDVEAVTEAEQAELLRRIEAYRGGRGPVPLEGRTVVLVDDGIATGYTARTAIGVLREKGAGRVVLAVPVASPDSLAELGEVADDVECLEAPRLLVAIGAHYRDFRQTSDAEVRSLLAAAVERDARPAEPPAGSSGSARSARDAARGVAREVGIDVAAGVRLAGTLTLPSAPAGLVLFAHGSGSGRKSPRNRAVAGTLVRAGVGTLLFDLLTPEESDDRALVFDIDLLADRLVAATRWVAGQPGMPGRIGYFGASTGAAAALKAAASLSGQIGAVVSRGGRPDLAADALERVTAPTLLVVGGDDQAVLALNQQAQRRLRCVSRLEVVPGASHLFQEPGALEAVADLASEWFRTYLRSAPDADG